MTDSSVEIVTVGVLLWEGCGLAFYALVKLIKSCLPGSVGKELSQGCPETRWMRRQDFFPCVWLNDVIIYCVHSAVYGTVD